MNFNTFKTEFGAFCVTPGTTSVSSGKASSFCRAIVYLAEYLGATEMTHEVVNEILLHEDELRDKNSAFYRQVVRQFTNDGHPAYITDGFVQAALRYLSDFRNRL